MQTLFILEYQAKKWRHNVPTGSDKVRYNIFDTTIFKR